MIKSILLPIDLNHDSSWKKAMPQAVSLARTHGAEIHAIAVIPDYGMAIVGSQFPKEFAENALKETRVALDTLLGGNIPDGIKVSSHVRHGTIYKEIIAAAGAHGCDTIVLASNRSEMKDYLLGPNSARVVRHAKQSVFVVR
jgi:nucleotide-binding universal stress UspA family protein